MSDTQWGRLRSAPIALVSSKSVGATISNSYSRRPPEPRRTGFFDRLGPIKSLMRPDVRQRAQSAAQFSSASPKNPKPGLCFVSDGVLLAVAGRVRPPRDVRQVVGRRRYGRNVGTTGAPARSAAAAATML